MLVFAALSLPTANILSSQFSPGSWATDCPLCMNINAFPGSFLEWNNWFLQNQNSGAILEKVHSISLQRTETELDLAPPTSAVFHFYASSLCTLKHPPRSGCIHSTTWPRGPGLLHHAEAFSHVDIIFESTGSSPCPVEWPSTSNIQVLHLLRGSWPKSSTATLFVWKLFFPFLESFCSLSCTNHSDTRSLEDSLSHPYVHK